MINNDSEVAHPYCTFCLIFLWNWNWRMLLFCGQGTLHSLRTTDVSPRSSPLRDVLQGGMSATQRQRFHTDDINQCLHNKSGSHGVPNANLFNFTFLLVDFGKVLCSSANELQQNSNASSREDYIPQILAVLLEIIQFTFDLCRLLSFICHS